MGVVFGTQCIAWFASKKMNAKSLTINKMLYFSVMINIEECD